jgi:hypothetical protein
MKQQAPPRQLRNPRCLAKDTVDESKARAAAVFGAPQHTLGMQKHLRPTLMRRGSATKPMRRRGLDRTVVKMQISFSRPCST